MAEVGFPPPGPRDTKGTFLRIYDSTATKQRLTKEGFKPPFKIVKMVNRSSRRISVSEYKEKFDLAKQYIIKKIYCFSKEEIQDMILKGILTKEDLDNIVEILKAKKLL